VRKRQTRLGIRLHQIHRRPRLRAQLCLSGQAGARSQQPRPHGLQRPSDRKRGRLQQRNLVAQRNPALPTEVARFVVEREGDPRVAIQLDDQHRQLRHHHQLAAARPLPRETKPEGEVPAHPPGDHQRVGHAQPHRLNRQAQQDRHADQANGEGHQHLRCRIVDQQLQKRLLRRRHHQQLRRDQLNAHLPLRADRLPRLRPHMRPLQLGRLLRERPLLGRHLADLQPAQRHDEPLRNPDADDKGIADLQRRAELRQLGKRTQQDENLAVLRVGQL